MLKIKKYKSGFLGCILFSPVLLMSDICLADGILPSVNKSSSWRAVVSVGGGVASFPAVGKSATFPVMMPVGNEFFIYSANRSNQNEGFFDVFLGTEKKLSSVIALQLGLSYSKTGSPVASGILTEGANVFTANDYTYNYNVRARQLVAEGKILYMLNDTLFPYVTGGVGESFNDAFDYQTTGPIFTPHYSDNNSQRSFSYNLGLGADLQICNNFRLGVGYRFADFGRANLGSALIGSARIDGRLSQRHLFANEVLAQVTWLS